MARPESAASPPYLRIAAELSRRIEDSELGPGDPLPSTRQIVQEFGVAMATASKALTALQNVGLARSDSPCPRWSGAMTRQPGASAAASPLHIRPSSRWPCNASSGCPVPPKSR